jgi:hypothetical protein
MAPTLPADNPRTLLNAANAAFTRLEASNPTLYKALTDAFIKSGLHDSFDVQVALNRLPNGTDKTALKKFFASPAALALAVSDAIGGAVKGVGGAIAKAGGIVGGLPQNVGDAVGKGLVSTVEPLAGIAGVLSTLTSPNTWLRIGEGVLGIVLIAVGVVAITKSTNAGKAITSTAVKAAKIIK